MENKEVKKVLKKAVKKAIPLIKGVDILFITDLHLRDEETGSTNKLVANNKVIFDELLSVINNTPTIKLVIFGGDIQDRMPKNLYEQDMWENYFEKIGKIMSERAKSLTNLEIENTTLEEIAEKGILFLPAIRGNHDNVKTLYSKEKNSDNEEIARANYTYFDKLINAKKIIRPKWLKFKDDGKTIFVDLRDYGEADRELPKESKGSDYVIAVYHDNIIHEGSNFWQKKDTHAYEAEEVLRGVDLGIVNHIHKSLEPLKIEDIEHQPILWQIGSVGRMKFNKDEYRDYGYVGLFNCQSEKLTRIELELIPKKEYFNIKKAIREKTIRQNYSDLKLQYEEVEVSNRSPLDVIKESTRIKDDVVRTEALKIMKATMEE